MTELSIAVPMAAETTGRYLVLLPDEDDRERGVAALQEVAGLEVTRTGDVPPDAIAAGHLENAPAVVFDALGVAVVTAPPEQVQSLTVASEPGRGHVLAIEPERIVYALERAPVTSADLPGQPVGSSSASLSVDYLRGYRDAATHLADAGGAGTGRAPGGAPVAEAALDQSRLTWGLQATRVPASHHTGAGIKVAVLDTGFDVQHPDFAGRNVVTQSHVPGVAVQDVVGHGTHCIGTACGPRDPVVQPRYGIAYGADIYVGKVLNDQGRGRDGDILAGIEWAIANRCEVISMSLGAPVSAGQAFSPVFERAARRALTRGTLIVAAAGNDSRRDQGATKPVSHPANCPSIMAIAALDASLHVAYFSNGGTLAQGGSIDLAGPGVDVRSAWPMPRQYNTISGTSMATPHVAGIAALTAEADPANRGAALWSALQRHAKRLVLPSTDVGMGLVRAP